MLPRAGWAKTISISHPGHAWNHPDVRVNLSGLIDVAGQAPIAQSQPFRRPLFSAFKRKNFLYFD